MEKIREDILVKDVKDQVRHAGLDPDDPVFLKHAGQAPEGVPLYDQVTNAIRRTRAEKEAREETRPVSLDDAIRKAEKDNVVR